LLMMLYLAQDTMDFMTNILVASAESSTIGKDLDSMMLLWNKGAQIVISCRNLPAELQLYDAYVIGPIGSHAEELWGRPFARMFTLGVSTGPHMTDRRTHVHSSLITPMRQFLTYCGTTEHAAPTPGG
jgi:hypothetical protein